MTKSSWQPVIGIEVHIELKTKSKMFCACRNQPFGGQANTFVCPVCLGLPGALPVPNQKAIEQTIVIGLALGCQINSPFWFDRKNYFYPDLPKGYQISQHFAPIGISGQLPILIDGQQKGIGISDIHLEEDTAKLLHQTNETWIDFNRSGVPLVEIVSKPEIHSSEEAKIYLKRIRQLVRYLGFSDCDMEKGSMRLEANISLTDKPGVIPDYRVEVKNLNSFRFVQKAIEYELVRQKEILENGQTPKQETRGFDLDRGITFPQRSKEVAKDYRYFPEPDIPPFEYSNPTIKKFGKSISHLPWKSEQTLISSGVDWQKAQLVCQKKKSAQLINQAIERGSKLPVSVKQLVNYLINKKPSSKTDLDQLIDLVVKDQNRFDLDPKKLASVVGEVITQNPKAVADYRQGKTQVIGFLIGQVQKKTGGRAHPDQTRQTLVKLIT
ncbi:MAG: Asp-tRNA(Asn)/Glu-tRNA(Gln) amidotransferase subunit GatB [Patescibacteria group bacterium]